MKHEILLYIDRGIPDKVDWEYLSEINNERLSESKPGRNEWVYLSKINEENLSEYIYSNKSRLVQRRDLNINNELFIDREILSGRCILVDDEDIDNLVVYDLDFIYMFLLLSSYAKKGGPDLVCFLDNEYGLAQLYYIEKEIINHQLYEYYQGDIIDKKKDEKEKIIKSSKAIIDINLDLEQVIYSLDNQFSRTYHLLHEIIFGDESKNKTINQHLVILHNCLEAYYRLLDDVMTIKEFKEYIYENLTGSYDLDLDN